MYHVRLRVPAEASSPVGTEATIFRLTDYSLRA
jgi:hypothetical protein